MFNLLFENNSIKQILIKNTFWLSFGNTISRLSKMILIIFATRILKPEGYGTFIYVVSMATLFFQFINIKVGDYFIRDYSSHENPDKLLGTIWILKLIMVTLGVFVGVIFGLFSIEENLRVLYLIILVMMGIDVLKAALLLVSTAKNKIEHYAWVGIAESMITTGLGILFLFTSQPLLNLGWAYLLASVATSCLSLIFVREHLHALFKWDVKLFKPVIIESIPFSGMALVKTLIIISDVIMIKWALGYSFVGHYSSAQKLYSIILEFGAAIAISSYPIMTAFKEESEKIKKMIKKISSVYLLLTLPITIGGWILADEIVLWLFGAEYLKSAAVLRIFVMIIPIQLLVRHFGTISKAMGHHKTFLKFYIVSGTVNVIGNLILIPKYGIIGAAISTGGAIALSCCLNAYFTAVKLKLPVLQTPNIIKLALSLIAMATAVTAMPDIHALLKIVAGGLVYLATLLILRERHCYDFVMDLKARY